ncbi:hypothetical protein M569_13201, partial [Genlisea aurea]
GGDLLALLQVPVFEALDGFPAAGCLSMGSGKFFLLRLCLGQESTYRRRLLHRFSPECLDLRPLEMVTASCPIESANRIDSRTASRKKKTQSHAWGSTPEDPDICHVRRKLDGGDLASDRARRLRRFSEGRTPPVEFVVGVDSRLALFARLSLSSASILGGRALPIDSAVRLGSRMNFHLIKSASCIGSWVN